jgi:hypothetical protein
MRLRQRGMAAAAFEVSERTRARALLGYLAESAAIGPRSDCKALETD